MHPPNLGAEALSSTLLAHGTRWGPLRARDLGGGSSDLVRQQQQWHCRHHESRWRRRRWWRRRRAGIERSAAPRLHRRNRLASRKSSRHGVGAAHCSLGDAICDGAHETGGCWLDAATPVESPTCPSKMKFCEGSFLKRLDSNARRPAVAERARAAARRPQPHADRRPPGPASARGARHGTCPWPPHAPWPSICAI